MINRDSFWSDLVGYEMLQLSHQLEDENDRTYDFEALQHHFQTSLNKPDDSEDREYGFCSMNSKRYESTIDVNKIDSEPAPSSSLRHSRTLSMPAIASSQLSDISERSEFVAPGQTRQYTIDGSCDQATTSDGQESGRKTVNENKVDEMNEVESKSDGQAQRKTSISSPQGKVTSETDEKDERRDGSESEMIGESSIEIKVQRASTTSEE